MCHRFYPGLPFCKYYSHPCQISTTFDQGWLCHLLSVLEMPNYALCLIVLRYRFLIFWFLSWNQWNKVNVNNICNGAMKIKKDPYGSLVDAVEGREDLSSNWLKMTDNDGWVSIGALKSNMKFVKSTTFNYFWSGFRFSLIGVTSWLSFSRITDMLDASVAGGEGRLQGVSLTIGSWLLLKYYRSWCLQPKNTT